MCEQVKMFYTIDVGCEELEDDVNAWLSKMGDKITISRVLQSESSHGRTQMDSKYRLALTIFYKPIEVVKMNLPQD